LANLIKPFIFWQHPDKKKRNLTSRKAKCSNMKWLKHKWRHACWLFSCALNSLFERILPQRHEFAADGI
jgi:hypothetical protein